MTIYNKLVRDKIPEIIRNDNKSCTTKILDEKQYITELQKKLEEEWMEYKDANSNEEGLEELADMLEVIYALAKTHGGSPEKLESIRAEKANKRGGFKEKIFLIEVQD